MVTLIIKKEIEEKQISSKTSKECRNKLIALFWEIYFKRKGYEVDILEDNKIK